MSMFWLKFWVIARRSYLLFNVLFFGTFPSLVYQDILPNGIIFCFYLIAGICGLLLIMDSISGVK